VKEFMLAYIEAIHDFKHNKEAALTVFKKIYAQRRPRGIGG
jgi:hypothetical protein